MFRSAATLICFSVAMAFDNDTYINVNNVDAQYYIGQFNGNEFPLAVGLCNPLDILAQGGSQIAECTDENTLTWNYYSDIDCSSYVTSTIYNDTWKTGTGTANDFNCNDNANTAYAEIEFEALGCGAAVKVTMHTAIGVCAFLADDEVSIQVYCEPEYAELYYFDSDGETSADCGVADLYNIANATGDECDFMLKTGGTKVYGQVMDCVGYDEETAGPTTVVPTTTSNITVTGDDDDDDDDDTTTTTESVVSGEDTTTTMGGDSSNANKYAFTFLSFGLAAIFTTLKSN